MRGARADRRAAAGLLGGVGPPAGPARAHGLPAAARVALRRRRACACATAASRDLALDEPPASRRGASRHGDAYIWTRKQPVRARGTSRSTAAPPGRAPRPGRRLRRLPRAATPPGDWCAGVGARRRRPRGGWNLVTGVHDAPVGSERTVWVDGVAARGRAGRVRRRPRAWHGRRRRAALRRRGERARRDDFCSLARQRLPPAVRHVLRRRCPAASPLAEGWGVMERHARAGDGERVGRTRAALRRESHGHRDGRAARPDHYRLWFAIAVAPRRSASSTATDLRNISGALLFITKDFDL